MINKPFFTDARTGNRGKQVGFLLGLLRTVTIRASHYTVFVDLKQFVPTVSEVDFLT